MHNYITEKFAGILTRDDTGYLFNTLTEKLHGNRSEAARQCGLTGKTTYDWETAGYVKFNTKRKVLEACLNINFLSTIEYLLKRSSGRTVDLLRTFLSEIYTEAIETNSQENFIDLLDKFHTLSTEYQWIINDRIKDEHADMLWILRQKALELNVPITPRSIDEISARELLENLPLISDIYRRNPQEAPNAIKTLNLPPQSVELLLKTFEKLQHTSIVFTEVDPSTDECGLSGYEDDSLLKHTIIKLGETGQAHIFISQASGYSSESTKAQPTNAYYKSTGGMSWWALEKRKSALSEPQSLLECVANR